MAALEHSPATSAPPPSSDGGAEAVGPAHPLGDSQKAPDSSQASEATELQPLDPVLVHDYAFEYYSSRPAVEQGPCDGVALAQLLQSGRRAPVLTLLTRHLVGTYETCNPGHAFRYKVPRRVLTQPKEGTLNDGRDNCEANLICSVGDTLECPRGTFSIIDLLGQGTFGQVFKCQVDWSPKPVAVKVVKNKPAYFRQAQSEVAVLKLLNEKHDPADTRHIVRLVDSFNDKNHLCLVFEMLDMNLYELLKQNQFRGLPLSLIRHFVVQILSAMMVMEDASIIHCDLKPENILLVGPPGAATGAKIKAPEGGAKQNQVKVIDFGSACLEGHTTYTYIQSRFYRSPEVLLGLPYDMAIDLWSFGCICAEMFLGLPIFPGVSEHNQMGRIVEMLGPPPDFMLDHGTNTNKYFRRKHAYKVKSRESESVLQHGDDDADDPALEGRLLGKPPIGGPTAYTLKTAEEYAADTRTPVVNSKKYFKHKRLQDIVRSYPYGRKLSKEETGKEDEERRVFLHFILGLLELNPWKRWTAKQAADHPFLTGEPLDPSYEALDSLVVRDRRLQSMLLAQQRLCARDSAEGQARSKPGPDGQHTAASYAAYLNAAAASASRPPPCLLSRSSDPIDITQQEAPPPAFEDPSTPSYPHRHPLHPAARGLVDDHMVRSAPQGTRIPQRGAARRSSASTAMSNWQAVDMSTSSGGVGSYAVRSTRGSFAGHKGGESYTYEASERATDFGYALQRPGVMMHFSPQQQGYMSSQYGGYGDVMMMNGGRAVLSGTSPHTNGMLGRSWGQHQGQTPHSSHMSMRSPASHSQQQGYMPPPPPMPHAPPPPGGYYGAEEEEPMRQHAVGGQYSPPAEQNGLDGAMAEWDPFFPEGLDEELSTSTSQQGGDVTGGAGQPPRARSEVSRGRDVYGASPKQPNGHGMGRGMSPHHGQPGPTFNTPPRYYRGPLSGSRPPSAQQPPAQHPRQRQSFSRSPQSWKMQQQQPMQPGSYSSARHRPNSSWHQPYEAQPHSLPDSLSKMPHQGLGGDYDAMQQQQQQQQQPPQPGPYGGVPMMPYWGGNGPRRRSAGPEQQQMASHGGGKAPGSAGSSRGGAMQGSYGAGGGQGGGGGYGRRAGAPVGHGMSGLAQELAGSSPSSVGGAASSMGRGRGEGRHPYALEEEPDVSPTEVSGGGAGGIY